MNITFNINHFLKLFLIVAISHQTIYANKEEFLKNLKEDNVSEVQSALREHPEYIHLVFEDGQTPLHVAGGAATIRALLEGGADPMARNRQGFTPFGSRLRADNGVREAEMYLQIVYNFINFYQTPNIFIDPYTVRNILRNFQNMLENGVLGTEAEISWMQIMPLYAHMFNILLTITPENERARALAYAAEFQTREQREQRPSAKLDDSDDDQIETLPGAILGLDEVVWTERPPANSTGEDGNLTPMTSEPPAQQTRQAPPALAPPSGMTIRDLLLQNEQASTALSHPWWLGPQS